MRFIYLFFFYCLLRQWKDSNYRVGIVSKTDIMTHIWTYYTVHINQIAKKWLHKSKQEKVNDKQIKIVNRLTYKLVLVLSKVDNIVFPMSHRVQLKTSTSFTRELEILGITYNGENLIILVFSVGKCNKDWLCRVVKFLAEKQRPAKTVGQSIKL